MDELFWPGKVDGNTLGEDLLIMAEAGESKIGSGTQIPCLTPAFPFESDRKVAIRPFNSKTSRNRIARLCTDLLRDPGSFETTSRFKSNLFVGFAGRHFAHRGFLTFPPRIIKMCGPAIPASELLVYRVYFH